MTHSNPTPPRGTIPKCRQALLGLARGSTVLDFTSWIRGWVLEMLQDSTYTAPPVCLLLFPPLHTPAPPNTPKNTQTHRHSDTRQGHRMFGSLLGASCQLEPQNLFGDSGSEAPECLHGLCLGTGCVCALTGSGWWFRLSICWGEGRV